MKVKRHRNRSRRIVRQFVEPATGDYAAHGIFDKRASAFSLQS